MTLTYRDTDTSGTQIEVLSHNIPIANISKQVLSSLAGSTVQWRWNLAITAAPPGIEYHGYAEALDEAKAAIERNWQAWLAAAGLSERDRR
jgi:hypothetical protein